MELNRNQFFLMGLVLLFIGLQLRKVDSFTLNEKVSRFIASHTSNATESDGGRPYLLAMGPAPRRTVRPPEWLGWALVSAASVLVLHSLAMKKPGG